MRARSARDVLQESYVTKPRLCIPSSPRLTWFLWPLRLAAQPVTLLRCGPKATGEVSSTFCGKRHHSSRIVSLQSTTRISRRCGRTYPDAQPEDGLIGLNLGFGDDLWGHDPVKLADEISVAVKQLSAQGYRYVGILMNPKTGAGPKRR